MSRLSALRSKLVLPARFKGTIVEKWAGYWKSLIADYGSMLADVRTEAQDKPVRALKIVAALAVATQLARHNPNQRDFREELRCYSNQLVLVGEPSQNPATVQHFKSLEEFSNRGLLNRLNLGVASLLWVSDYDEGCDLYRAKCDYLQPGYFSIPYRIVDVGFMGKWWNLYRKHHNFDINV